MNESVVTPTASEVTIRMLKDFDGREYQALRLRALLTDPEAFLSSFDSEKNKAELFFERELEFSCKDPCYGYYGAFHGQKLIAFAQLGYSYLAKQPHIAFLYNVYVEPTYRGTGVARQLWEAMLHRLLTETTVERVFVNCLAKNRAALGFYDRLGFVTCGVKPKSVKWQNEYDDEVEMVLEIK